MSPASPLTDDLILAFDAGTQSIRCGLFDLVGQLVDLVKLPIQPYFSPRPGFAEQQPDHFWQKLCQTSQQLTARSRGLVDRIKAVTLTTQRGVYINLGRDGKPLRPAISWLDERLADKQRWAPLYLELGMKIRRIHSDLEKGFIRAETVPWRKLLEAGGLPEAKRRGWLRLEGKEYTVQDGDVLTIRFNL